MYQVCFDSFCTSPLECTLTGFWCNMMTFRYFLSFWCPSPPSPPLPYPVISVRPIFSVCPSLHTADWIFLSCLPICTAPLICCWQQNVSYVYSEPEQQSTVKCLTPENPPPHTHTQTHTPFFFCSPRCIPTCPKWNAVHVCRCQCRVVCQSLLSSFSCPTQGSSSAVKKKTFFSVSRVLSGGLMRRSSTEM